MTDRNNRKTIDIIIQTCIGICIVFSVLFFIYGQFFVKNVSLYANESEPYDAVWSYTDPSGVTRQYTTNETIDIRDVDELRLTTVLPDEIGDGNCLFILSGKDFDAYVDGELRNSYRLSYSVFGRNVKGVWVPITLRRGDAGKELTIVRTNYWLDEFRPGEMYIGNRLGFAMTLIHDNLFILFLSFAIITFSAVIFIICFVYRIKSRRGFPLWYLSLGVLGVAFWLILDNFTYPLIFGNYFVDGVTSYLVIMLILYPFAAFINMLTEDRYRKIYHLLSILIIANFVSLTLLYFMGIYDFIDTMPLNNIIMAIVAVYCLGTILYDTFKNGHRENMIITIGYAIFSILCMAEIIHLNLDVHKNDGAFVAIGLMILLIVSIAHEIRRISELRAETLEAQSANLAKTTFLANMSHEIRTPINAILGMDELILREDTDPKIREYALNIKGAGTALLEIISDVLDFSKIEQGKMDIINAEYDTTTFINSVISMIGVKADEKGLDFVKDISDKLPSKLIGDEKRLREVLINLLSNAVKYTHKGSVTLAIKHEDTGNDGVILFISVKDTGIGIKESDKDKLFKQFERLDHSKTRSIEGTGLGLAIAANLVRLMNGTIDCKSVYGEGTEFIVKIPQIVTDQKPIGDILSKKAAVGEAETKEELADLTGVKVLVVDDNKMNLKVTKGLLGILKADTTVCGNGGEMLELITKEKFDVILLDHMMPEMDGIETLERAKTLDGNLNGDTSYIALTANAIAGAKEMYLECGFSDYLSKPMKVEELSAVIKANLRS